MPVTITIKIFNVKYVFGNKITNWTPAPEDVQSQITTNASHFDMLSNKIGFDVSSQTFTNASGTLSQRVDTAESNIGIQAGEISSKVSANGVISVINQSSESVTIDASKINLNGYVTATSLQTGPVS